MCVYSISIYIPLKKGFGLRNLPVFIIRHRGVIIYRQPVPFVHTATGRTQDGRHSIICFWVGGEDSSTKSIDV